MYRKWATTATCFLFLFSGAQAETTWPQFRGPDGQGRSDATGLPLRWDESTNIVWKTPIDGKGWSSPVVADGKVWLTAATQVAASEDERQARVEGIKQGERLAVANTISLWANEVDLRTGKVLRQVKLADVDSPQPIHALNSYASPTPVLAEGRLYCHFGDYGTFCLDTDEGKVVWQKRFALEHAVGPGSSPLLFDDLLIVPCDGTDAQYILALHSSNGKTAWKKDRPPLRAEDPDVHKAFCTPLLIQYQGEQQLVIPGSQWCVAYRPRTGEAIWRVDYDRGFSTVPRPVFDGKHVFICTGFSGKGLWAISPDGRGDVTETHVEQITSKQVPHMSSPVVFGERLYTVNDAGIAQCFDTTTRKQLWKKRVGGKFSASLLYADRRIYLCSHEGRTTVLAAGDEYQEIATNDLDGQLMASPVVADGDLLLRTESHLYRIGE